MDITRTVWNERYDKAQPAARAAGRDSWLEPWIARASGPGGRRALDIGCGAGRNTVLLLDTGFDVTAIDISDSALRLCALSAPGARIVRSDIREGLPFPAGGFDLIVAELSLHYFRWAATCTIARDIANCLAPGGIFAARFNSVKDVNYGAGGGEPVAGEENMFVVDGLEKRFFTRECLEKLFGPPWAVAALEEKTAGRFNAKKVFWEIAAVKNGRRKT